MSPAEERGDISDRFLCQTDRVMLAVPGQAAGATRAPRHPPTHWWGVKGCKATTGHSPKQQQGARRGPAFGRRGAVAGTTGLWREQTRQEPTGERRLGPALAGNQETAEGRSENLLQTLTCPRPWHCSISPSCALGKA